ncbi:NAD(P)H-dependent oxidoreductase [Pseudovibrio ascidiaceicola]|uniref:NAD(P)H-dependent oxidoreductase n=1 Tax=Pseudovibrio ascidiaceicola TaxID=285279 RepID=UPI000D68BDD1|nr:NAD(P)H-dependent oxidoreductase [Pseudovibrio ascidiaceicola]
MKAHIVVAHPESKSVNGTLAQASSDALSDQGMEVTFSDLYRMKFDPCDRPEQYATLSNRDGFHVQTEQRFHAENGTTPTDVAEEVQRLVGADLLIVHFPLWWFGMPAMLKGWMDRVFVYGSVYRSTMRHDTGLFRNKRMIACVTTGSSAEACSHDGIEGDTKMHLWPILYPFRYIGFEVLMPEVFHGVGSTTCLEGSEIGKTGLDTLSEKWGSTLKTLSSRQSLQYNKDSDFDSSKRLKNDAPNYSPFISHRSLQPCL